jgi:AcrR family transcriptional regulator
MRAIARDLGYSPAALYEYFPAKEDICRALYFEGADGLSGMMQRALDDLPPSATPLEEMAALGIAYRSYALQVPELFRLVFTSTVAGFNPGQAELDRSREGYELLVNTARKGIENGDFIEVPAEILALSCWAAVHGFVMLELSGLIGIKTGGPAQAGPNAPSLDALFAAKLELVALGTLKR